ncbi:MAG: Na+/H+ antiporter NhaA [Candidatus Hydrogenedentota bacterium]|nr:MAG: Na+/H+ antiporter NhaA [Candidatus Hydrogenedentota bacterium]
MSEDQGGDTSPESSDSKNAQRFVAPPLEHVTYLKRFLHHDLVGSGLLLTATLAAVIVANVGYAEQYHNFWNTKVGLSWGANAGFEKTLHHWVNDGLMSIFFFLVGMEIKRELLAGELATFRKAMLPAAAAVGGMVIPALIYFIINRNGEGVVGWGIPMATDIAFAAGCIAMLRKWVPPALMVFLVALAIVDDLGAVAVIALFYTDKIAVEPLMIGSLLIILSFMMGLFGVRQTWPFLLIGAVIWLAFLQSGIHATIAGVLLAFSIPEKARYHTHHFHGRVRDLLDKFTKAEKDWDANEDMKESELKDLMVNPRQQGLIRHINTECHHVEAPLQRIEHKLEPLCVFIIMPIFAFANAGIHIDFGHIGETIFEPVALGIILGLCVGKPLGVVLAAYIAVKLGWAALPKGVSWLQITGVGMLAGIGFTMSLFINELAFRGVDPTHMERLMAEGKIGIFVASIISAIAGLVLLRMTCKEPQTQSTGGGH